ncbi:right-handed parallel beta-helix repeat-containing protein [Solitalea lacus]|uniref:right-handed parallel beta-helix repeat-containing protein n=1 Tax=Solitalea lacus TaxID=2911172 RepID=UPI001EDB146C|nr:right-handed parallel beta-helix repeat-containing protein [Solitalea lacus]UKJ07223.1 right-handed parallel beta-helix repeat-containing protein [Solitalea lacus]
MHKKFFNLNLTKNQIAAFTLLTAFSFTSLVSCKEDEAITPTEQQSEATVQETSPQVEALTTTTTALDVRVDFGGSTLATKYNSGSIAVGTKTLADFNSGAATKVTLATVEPFAGTYTNSQTYSSTLGFAQAAAVDAGYGNTTSRTRAVLELANLDPATEYNLSFFASRVGVNSTTSLETQYKVIGASTQTLLLEAANNTSKVVTTQAIKPNSSGKIRIEVSKGSKNNISSGSYWLNSMKVVSIAAPTEPTAPTAPTAPTEPTAPTAPTAPTTPTNPSYNYLVKTVSELKAAASKATSGQVIYVDNSAQIDFTGQGTLKIPGGVTLMSGRGDNGALGGMIYTTSLSHGILIQAGGTNVKVVGLRVRGGSTGTSGSSTYNRGIYTSFSNLEVSNCEIFGWNHAGVYLSGGASNIYIHHNYFHHNQQDGLGYGVSMTKAYAKIEYNYFNYNRHCIAGSGIAGSGYEAAYNVVMPNTSATWAHSFDMHGDGGDGAQYTAGDYVNIHDNTFYNGKFHAITVRGTPKQGTTIKNNKFVHASQSAALNLYATNNTISTNTYGIATPTLNPGPATM